MIMNCYCHIFRIPLRICDLKGFRDIYVLFEYVPINYCNNITLHFNSVIYYVNISI